MTRKGTPPPGRRAPKRPVVTDAPGPTGPGPTRTGPTRTGPRRTEPPEGCPEEVEVVGRADESPTIGEAAELTLAAGRAQLVVARKVAEILSTEPPLDVITRCLQLGETYLGNVTDVSPEQFSARLTRRG